MEFQPIGFLKSCYEEKFGIPRQPGLVPEADSFLTLKDPALLQGLEEFSHVWVVFVFHDLKKWNERPTIRPPRLGGKKRLGIFATRTPHRPNPIGISAVKLERIDWKSPGGPTLHFLGGDFLDGTPVLDIKPYIKYADSIPRASTGWLVTEKASSKKITLSARAKKQLAHLPKKEAAALSSLARKTIALDPRPRVASRKQEFGMRLKGHNIRWKYHLKSVEITEVLRIP
jgi:tRNA-Thr(GGU) m(6)t(6)A37 methyltransferase TsaA